MSSTIQAPSLFAEAAYGPEGVPGLNGVTGGGEAHDMAWQNALADAQACALVNDNPDLISDVPGVITEPQANVPVGEDMAMGAGKMKEEHPLSWDRLSMTVASMVAWNMQVSMADDSPAGVFDSGPLEAQAETHSILGASGEFVDSDLEALEQSLTGGSTATIEVASSETVKGSTLGGQAWNAVQKDAAFPSQSIDQAPATQAETSVLSNDLQTDSTLLREGADTTASLEGLQVNSTEASLNSLQSQVERPTGTSLPTQDPTIMKVSQDVLVSEIPSSQTQSAQDVSSVPGEALTKSAPGKGADSAEFKGVVRVNESSVSKSNAAAGLTQLEGIRSALAELDAQAAIRAQVAAFHADAETPVAKEAPVTPMTANATTPVASSVAKSETVAAAQPIKGHKAREQNGVSMSGTIDGSDADLLEERPRPPGMGTAFRELSGNPQERVMKMPMGQTAQNQDVTVQSTVDINAAHVGAENAEISADQDMLVESIATNSEIIEASEVPELPIQDASHLDIDIDDQAGRVRLAMTKEGQEVAIRMETPQEVLEEYRQMESELDEAIAGQGLDLSEFSASSHDGDEFSADGDGDGKSSGSKRNSNQGMVDAVSDEPGTLEQDGTTARLVNRIV